MILNIRLCLFYLLQSYAIFCENTSIKYSFKHKKRRNNATLLYHNESFSVKTSQKVFYIHSFLTSYLYCL